MTLPAESPSLDLDQSPIEAKRFDQLPLSESVQRSIERTGYQTPTSVQAAIIPAMAAGSDVLAQSQTGTGKTAAFALPMLDHLTRNQRGIGKGKPSHCNTRLARNLSAQVFEN